MQVDEHEAYGEYSLPVPYVAPASVGVLERPSDIYIPTEEGPVVPPSPPAEPPVSPPPAAPKPRRRGRTGAILLLTLILALIFSVGLFSGWQYAQTSTTTKAVTSTTATTSSVTSALETQQEAAIAKVEPAVVEIMVTTAQGEQIGSGVIIDAQGDIVTNNHVVSGEQSIKVVLYNGNTEQAQLIGTDASADLAVVRIAPYANMTVAQIGDSSRLTVGQEVLAIGNPLGITETATKGIVSALNRSVTESAGTTISNAIQTDAALNPGNSGGALVNLQGQLVGIPTLSAVNTESNTAANGLSFAIPSNLVKTAVQQMLQQ